MNLDILFVVLFYGFLLIIFFIYRKKFEVQDKVFVMYKTKLGLKLMDKLAKKCPRFLHYLSYLSIFTGFSGMLIIFFFLVKGTYNLIIIPESQPLLAPVLPGIKIAGLPVLSFWHWIIAILFVATIHEFSHGVYARLCDTKIKSSGFAFLGPILAAFVEPDEKQLMKKTRKQQLSVLSAGPFSNIVSSFIILIITILIVNPLAANFVELQGIQISSLEKDFPAELSGIRVGEQILEINNIEVQNPNNFSDVLKDIKPGDEIIIKTNQSSYAITATKNPNDHKKGYMGIVVSPINLEVKNEASEKYGHFIPYAIFWVSKLFFWLYAISLGVGLFNLLPLGPVDGGRMFNVLLSCFIKNKKLIKKIFFGISLFCLLLIFINLLPYLIKLFLFLLKPILIFLV